MNYFNRLFSIAILGCLLLAGTGVMAADVSTSGETAAAQVSVTSVTLDPGVFVEGDTGTVTIQVTNTGVDSVAIHRATMYDNDFTVISSLYDSVGAIGGGNSMKFTFTVKATAPEGIYYPVFSIEYRDAGSLRYPVKIQVQDSPLSLSILEKPDTFSNGKKDSVNILVGNPRDNQVNGVTITPVAPGADIIPSSYFIGVLEPDNSTAVSFDITPHQSGDIVFRVDYKNGVNPHSVTLALPVTLADSKKQAEPIISNILETIENGNHRITGDVTNAGLTPAKSVTVTPGPGTTPIDPYKTYVVGSLEPDDFASFEVTFSAENVTSVPLLVSWKDIDGNLYTKTAMVEITDTTATPNQSQGIPLTIIAIIIVAAAVVAGIVLYSWKKR